MGYILFLLLKICQLNIIWIGRLPLYHSNAQTAYTIPDKSYITWCQHLAIYRDLF